MNKTRIDWCEMTWNPMTGCLHGCEYCYARRTARRFGSPYSGKDLHILDCKPGRSPYPYEFAPTLRRYRMKEPAQKQRGLNIFVCSMADLFGSWVPDSWIKEVFAACEAAPQHNYLFLTKNPERYAVLADAGKLPKKANLWYGTTTPTQEKPVFRAAGYKTFVSLEPLLGPFHGLHPLGITADWIIIGAMTGPGSEQYQPKREWVEAIVEQCRFAGIPVFMKDNLSRVWKSELLRQYPNGLLRV